MNSRRVAHGRVCLQNIVNALCVLLLFETRGARLSNLDGGRNNGNPYFYNVKSLGIRIQHVAPSGNRKIKLLARTRMQGVRRQEAGQQARAPSIICIRVREIRRF